MQPTYPIGPNFSTETMRAMAERYGATQFVEYAPTNNSDIGYLINPTDTPNQYGSATYQTAQGFTLTHSVADYIPAAVRNQQVAAAKAGQAPMQATPFFVDVIDIAVPYELPHVVVLPRLHKGIARIFQPAKQTWGSKNVTAVRLEGDFSEFVTAWSPKGEEVDAFIYLAPNIMSLVLDHGTDFTIEFIGQHIYVYYRQSDMKKVNTQSGHTTYITPELHEAVLKTGLAIADRLARAARPASQPTSAPQPMPKPSTGKILLAGFWPILLVLVSLFVFAPLLLVTLPIALIVLIARYLRETRRYSNYQSRYGTKV